MAKRDLLEMEASLYMTTREIPSVAKGWLYTLCCWEAVVHTLDWSFKKVGVLKLMIMMMNTDYFTCQTSDAHTSMIFIDTHLWPIYSNIVYMTHTSYVYEMVCIYDVHRCGRVCMERHMWSEMCEHWRRVPLCLWCWIRPLWPHALCRLVELINLRRQWSISDSRI